jgi:hypothetical protein
VLRPCREEAVSHVTARSVPTVAFMQGHYPHPKSLGFFARCPAIRSGAAYQSFRFLIHPTFFSQTDMIGSGSRLFQRKGTVRSIVHLAESTETP